MERSEIRTYLFAALAAAAAFAVFLRFFLPAFLPFLIGLAIACAAEPAVLFLMRRAKLPRGAAAGAAVLVLYVLLGTGLTLLLRRGLYELGALSGALPNLLAELVGPAEWLHTKLESLAAQVPDGLGELLRSGVDELFRSGQALVSRLCEQTISLVSHALTGLPDAFLFLVTAVLSSFFIAAELPQLRGALPRLLPARWAHRLSKVTALLKRAFGGWCLAQLKLMGVTFVLITCGLWILRFPYALLLGGLIAIVDALPLFGTGTILIPWSLVQFLQHNIRCGIGLLVLYGVAALTRTALEPRLIGKQVGLSPLVTLVCLYAGYRFFGVIGMILLPIFAILLRQILISLRA